MEKEPKKNKAGFEKIGSFIKRTILKYWHAFVDAFLHDQKAIAKYVISFAAILHLILSSIQIEAISRLINQLCGITMFMFILLGFVCLFNAIRLKEPKGKSIVFSIVMLCLVMAAGVYLITIYFNALATQKNVAVGPISNGIILSIVILALYLIGLVETIVACVYYHNKKRKEKQEIVNA